MTSLLPFTSSFWFLFIFLTGSDRCQALPTTLTTGHPIKEDVIISNISHSVTFSLSRRAVLAYNDILEAVSEKAEELASAAGTEPVNIFYTSMRDGQAKGICWALQNDDISNTNFITFFNALQPADAVNFLSQAAGDGNDIDKTQKLISRAMAQTADGTVFLLFPDGDEPLVTSTWILYEFPAIQHDNAFALEVIRVDPATRSTQRIWKRGDEPTLPPPLD